MNKRYIACSRVIFAGKTIILAFLLWAGLSGAAICQTQEGLIRISPKFYRIPIAVPDFHVEPRTEAAAENARQALKILMDALDFTGMFHPLHKNTFPVNFNAAVPESNLEDWTKTGAHYLLTAVQKIEGDTLSMEFRLYGVHEKRLLRGKFYKSRLSNQRGMIMRFCNEVMHQITGLPGLFESRIIFVSNTTGTKEIYICDFDGSNPAPFTQNKSINLFPAWSRDGKWIAYTSFVGGNPDIYVRGVTERTGYKIAYKGINTTPAWVPGDTQFAATLSHEGDQEIYLLTLNGKISKKLTHSWGINTSPTFSPDGRKMAFVSGRGGSPQIYIKNLDTDREERLTFEGRYNTQPKWSPKGDKIAYSSMDKNEINICVIDVNGKGKTQLTGGSGKNESPSWSPDGSMIVFSSTREGASKLYIMTSHGTDQRRLLNMKGEQFSPDWSPAWVDR